MDDIYRQVIDDMLVASHLGVASSEDDYNTARQRVQQLIKLEVDIAADPAVNGGFSLQKTRYTPMDGVPVKKVLLDGKEVRYVSEADTAEGWVEVLVMDDKGNYVVENGRVQYKKLYGKVEVELHA